MEPFRMFDTTLYFTVWKFQDFYVTQILREIDFGECRGSDIDVFAILVTLKMINLVYFSLQKVQKSIKIKIRSL